MRARPAAGCVAATFAGSLRRALAQNYAAPSLDDLDTVTRLAPQLASASAVTLDVRSQPGRRSESIPTADDRRSACERRDRPALHLQSADARLSAAGFPAGRRRGHLPDVVVRGSRTDHRKDARHRDLSQQPRFVRRAAGVRGLDRHHSRDASERPVDRCRARLFRGVPVVRAARCRWTLLRHSGRQRLRYVPAAASGAVCRALAADGDRAVAGAVGPLSQSGGRSPLFFRIDTPPFAARLSGSRSEPDQRRSPPGRFRAGEIACARPLRRRS